MTEPTNGAQSPRAAAPFAGSSNLYRAVWRWHFYAGLLILPFMITMALTGAIYLFREEVDRFVHADFMYANPVGQLKLVPSEIIAAALVAQPGRAVKYTDPPADNLSAEVTVQPEQGGRMAVYVNQYSGEVLEVRADRSTVSWTIRYLHSFRFFGSTPRMWIEIVAGFSILLVATGVYLWWPRGRRGGVMSVRGKPRQRIFWRDTHAVTGAIAGVFIVFLALTGLPWSSVLGASVNQWANGSNFGYPAGLRVDVPMSEDHLDHVAPTSWSLEQALIPQTTPPLEGSGESSAGATASIGVDQAVAAFDRMGLHRGYSVALPSGPTGVFSGSIYPDDLSQQRVVHLDQYTGEPLIDMSYADYGPLGRALEWGINTHMGQTYGLLNQIVLVLACMAIVLLAVSAAVMWWKRRPAGSLGVPPLPSDRKVFIGLFVILAIGGLLFPLTGMALLVMVLIDLIWQWASPARHGPA